MSDSSPAMVAQQLHRLTQDIGLVGEGGRAGGRSIGFVGRQRDICFSVAWSKLFFLPDMLCIPSAPLTPAPCAAVTPALPRRTPGPLYSSSVDIAYVRCKTPGSHRLNYTQWLKVLCILSDESGWDLFQLLMEHAYKLGTKGLPPPVVGVRGQAMLASATECDDWRSSQMLQMGSDPGFWILAKCRRCDCLAGCLVAASSLAPLTPAGPSNHAAAKA